MVKLRNKRRGPIEVRFIADANQKSVYVWDAFNTAHAEAAKALKTFIQGDYFKIDLFFTGTAMMDGTSLTYKESDTIDGYIRKVKMKKTNDDFYNRGKKIIDNKDIYAELYKFADKYIEGASDFFKSL